MRPPPKALAKIAGQPEDSEQAAALKNGRTAEVATQELRLSFIHREITAIVTK